jgi:hypothetical protein
LALVVVVALGPTPCQRVELQQVVALVVAQVLLMADGIL